jgi:N-acyl-D-aspartate/D-glutamate deacylase
MKIQSNGVRWDVLIVVAVKNAVCWDVILCRLVDTNRLEKTATSISRDYPQDGGSRFLCNSGKVSTRLQGVTSQQTVLFNPKLC